MELTLHRLYKAANKAWKDVNNTIFSHLLKYDTELATFISFAEDTLKSSSQPTSDLDKVSEAEHRSQWYEDAQLMDKSFGTWHDQMISEGHDGWKEHTEMCCDHREAHKELQH